ncbi:MAG: GGDEF domain-containing protein [Actinomycetia bacterium]|nr:GGDEF domain-containing protein [Actinomycetes bacterium]
MADLRAVELDQSLTLEQNAIHARQSGSFELAAELFCKAAEVEDDLRKELDLQIRQACCMLAVERHEEAAALAEIVAKRARTEGFLAELADALGLIVDHHMRSDRLAEASNVLAEAMYTLDQLPNESRHYQVVHNMAATYATCGFVKAALDLYDRALHLADNDGDRQYTYGSMASAYHYAAQREQDPNERQRLIHAGLYAATAALERVADVELLAMGGALAHRAMMLAEIGHFESALDDARLARRMTLEHGIREEQIVAMAAEAIARWGSTRDPNVLELIDKTLDLAREIGYYDFLAPLLKTEIEALWSIGRLEEARIVMERQLREAGQQLYDERAARWEHVRLGVEHRRVEAISESDPLTGLPNRRYLNKVLPNVLDHNAPVCIGVIDLDGFKHINDEYGYMQGDTVLQEVAVLLERVCRRGDSVARLGGDEFVMLLGNTSPGDALMVFERVRTLIAQRVWHGVPAGLRLTASIGVTVGGDSANREHLLTEAVTALQVAKRTGRDRISFR